MVSSEFNSDSKSGESKDARPYKEKELAAKEKGSKSCAAHPQHVVEAGGDADDSQSTRETAGGGQEGKMDGGEKNGTRPVRKCILSIVRQRAVFLDERTRVKSVQAGSFVRS